MSDSLEKSLISEKTDGDEEEYPEDIPQKGSWVDEEEFNEEEHDKESEELGEKLSLHNGSDYTFYRDARIINLFTIFARRFGGIQHQLEEANTLLKRIGHELGENNRLMRRRMRQIESEVNEGGEPVMDDALVFKKHVMDLFQPDVRKNLAFTFNDYGVVIKPLKFLGTDIWKSICNIVNRDGGEWVRDSKDNKNSHWKIEK